MVNTFRVYLQLPDESSSRKSSLRSELQSCGLSITGPSTTLHIPSPHSSALLRLPAKWKKLGRRDDDRQVVPLCRKSSCSLHIYFSVDIMAFVKDNSPPTTVILISDDRDFTYLLSTIRWRQYNIVLVNSSIGHESSTVQAFAVYDWESDVLKTPLPSKLPSPSDDRNVADPTSESTMVHFSILRTVLTHLSFQLDQSSPKTIDPIDEDGVYPPTFVSAHAKCTPTQLLISEPLDFSGNDSIGEWRRYPLLSRIPPSR